LKAYFKENPVAVLLVAVFMVQDGAVSRWQRLLVEAIEMRPTLKN